MGVEKIEQITSILGVDASKITLISIWIFCFFLAMKLLGSGPTNDKGREDLAKIAGKLSSQLRTFYNGSVATMLLFIDKWARDRFVAKTIRSLPKGLRPFKAPSPWSVGLYDMTLKLALAYPIVFLIFGWLLSGNILVDLRMFLPQIPEITHRGLIIFGLVISVFFIYRFKRSTGGHAMLYLVLVGVGFIP